MNSTLQPGSTLSTFRLGDVLARELRAKPGKAIEVTLDDGSTISTKTVILKPQSTKGAELVNLRTQNYARAEEQRNFATLYNRQARPLHRKLEQAGWFERESVELHAILSTYNDGKPASIKDLTPEQRAQVVEEAKNAANEWKSTHRYFWDGTEAKWALLTKLATDAAKKAEVIVKNLGAKNPWGEYCKLQRKLNTNQPVIVNRNSTS